MKLIPTILCGGAGSRLWPVSRELHPKPFIRLADGQSLLLKAFLRGATLPGVQEILTVTNRELLFKTQDEFREVNAAALATSFILEPFGRNSGMFCFTAGTMLQQMQAHCSQILAATKACLDKSATAQGTGFTQLALDPDTFAQVPDNSIDYAVMEKSDQVCVVPCTIGWSDIGSWTALGDLAEPDANGNRLQGEALMHSTRNCTIQSHHRLVGTVGLEDLIIIDTPDAVLVAKKSSAQDVKHIYAELKAKGHEAHNQHRPCGIVRFVDNYGRA